MTTVDESFAVYCAGEQLAENGPGITYVYARTPIGRVRMTADEADDLGHKLIDAAEYDRRLHLSDEDAANPYLDPYPWAPEPALTIVVHGRPAPQGSKKYAGHRRNSASGRVSAVLVEQSKRVKPWRALVLTAAQTAMVAEHIKRYGGRPMGGVPALDGPLAAEVVFTVLKPVSSPKRRRTWPTTRHSGDLDKLLRSTFDGIADAEAIADDARIIRVTAEKTFPGEHPDALDQPGALIRLYTLNGATQ